MGKYSNMQISKYTNLISDMVALVGSLIVFLFFINFGIDSIGSHKIYIVVKPGYSSWVWGIFSISSMLYYFIRSKGTTTTGGYINPLFSVLLKVMRIIPPIGLVFSLIYGTQLITENLAWNTIISASSSFLDSILILFLVANFGVGVQGIRYFFKKPRL